MCRLNLIITNRDKLRVGNFPANLAEHDIQKMSRL